MRTFVAIELTESCRHKLAEAVRKLRAAAGEVRWVKAETAHLTLKFIGELPERDLPEAISALSAAAADSEPFRFRVEGISGFPPTDRPRVIHVPVHESSGALQRLAEAVERGLFEAIGLAQERRSFKPHITLGRVKERRNCPSLEEIAALVPDADFGEVPVDGIVLVKSDLTPRGAVYTALERMPLGS